MGQAHFLGPGSGRGDTGEERRGIRVARRFQQLARQSFFYTRSAHTSDTGYCTTKRGWEGRSTYTTAVQISAKVDYGMRALLVLVAASQPMTVEAIAADQAVPSKFLGVILNELRRAGILVSHRGREAGYNLARPAAHITTADVFRVLDGPLAQVHGLGPKWPRTRGPPSTYKTCG